MSKTVKRIISSLLVFAAIATVEPVNYINFITQKANAASYNSSDYALLDSLDSDEGDIHFSDTKSSVTLRVKSSVDQVRLTAKAKNNDYKVIIEDDEETGDNSETLDLDHGRNDFKIKVKDPSGNKTSTTYSVHITRGSSSYHDDDDDDDDDDVCLDEITVSGNSINFSRNKKSYNVEVGESIDKVRIRAMPNYDDDTVEINGTEVDSDDDYRRWISINHGKNEIRVRVEDGDDNYKTYTLNIYRGEKAPAEVVDTSETKKEERQGSIYLDDLNLFQAGTNIYFEPKKTEYNVNVASDYDNILIKAETEDEDDIAEVNGEEVGEDHYKRVNLQDGKNAIKVQVHNNYKKDDDDYEQRTYTINVFRGTSAGTTTDTNTSSSNSETATNSTGAAVIANSSNKDVKANQWVEVSGKWQYNDSLGNPLKSQWFFDRNHGKWYYLGADGNMQIGWILVNSKYYFLYDDGSMASDTSIGQYNVGSDGSWIG